MKNQSKHKLDSYKEGHSTNKKLGMGDFYGSGMKNPIGKMRSDSPGNRPVAPSKLGKPPKGLA